MFNIIELKYGRVRNLDLTDDFKAKNTPLIERLLEHVNMMRDKGWRFNPTEEYNNLSSDEKTQISETLACILDEFHALGCEIYNSWECRVHETPDCYRKYLHGYNT
jgi:hypothetical protein